MPNGWVMFCNQCGEENRNDRKFCANCGAPLKDYTKQPTQEELLMPQDVIDANNKQKQDKKRYWVRHAVSIVLILVACICVIVSNFVFKGNRTVQIWLSSIAVVLSFIYITLVIINAKYARKQRNAKKD